MIYLWSTYDDLVEHKVIFWERGRGKKKKHRNRGGHRTPRRGWMK